MKTYHYTECGLQNVYIHGMSPIIDDDGDEVIEVRSVNKLHAEISRGIVQHQKGISGPELRFLRTRIGLTQDELAKLVHRDKQTVGRWERSENEIDSTSETVIRKLAIEKLNLSVTLGIDELARSSVPTAETQAIKINAQNGSYELVAA